jgi:hypothetical protein
MEKKQRLIDIFFIHPKIGKNMIFWRKIVIFHTKYPKNFAPPSAIGKNTIFCRKIVIEKSMEYQNKPIKSQRNLIQIHSIFPTQTETLLYFIQSL